MPKSALEHVAVDYVLRVSQMGAVLRSLTQAPLTAQEGNPVMPDETPPGQETVEETVAAQEQGERDGMLTVYTCPECGGSLWQVNAGSLVRFRCHTGHVLSGATLFTEQAENIDKSLWHAARSLRDKARLARQLAQDARGRGDGATAESFEEKGQTDDLHADMLERMIQANAEVDQSP